MNVLIRDMEMPTDCMDCSFKGFDRTGGRGNICTINDSITLHAVLDGINIKFVRMGDCPLIPIPPHGRIGDLDELAKKIEHDRYNHTHTDELAARHHVAEYGHFLIEIAAAPTIIPAEPPKEE